MQFEFLNFSIERDHLKQISESERSELENSIKDMLQTTPDLSAYAIAKKLCRDESKFNSFKVKVSRIVKRISNNGNNSNICYQSYYLLPKRSAKMNAQRYKLEPI